MGKQNAGVVEVEEEQEQEEKDELETPADEKVDETELEPGAEPNSKPGGEDTEDREGAGGDEEEAAQELETPDPRDEKISSLEKKIEELSAGLKKPPEPAPAKELTEEQWAQLEEKSGMSRGQMTYVTNQSMQVMGYLKKMIDEKFGKFEKENAISELSLNPKFADIGKYRSGIDEFLKSFPSEHYSNPELLEKAYYFAKGLGSSAAVKKALNSGERNKKIVGNARPASPTSGGSKKSVKLTPIQESARKAAGMSVEEYIKFMK